MIKFEHRGSRINTGDLRTPISFYVYVQNDGPEAGENELGVAFECFAKVEKVFLRDVEQAKANGTLEDITIKMRDPLGDFMPDNRHYIGVNDRGYFGKRYNIKSVQPDLQNVGFIVVIGELAS